MPPIPPVGNEIPERSMAFAGTRSRAKIRKRIFISADQEAGIIPDFRAKLNNPPASTTGRTSPSGLK